MATIVIDLNLNYFKSVKERRHKIQSLNKKVSLNTKTPQVSIYYMLTIEKYFPLILYLIAIQIFIFNQLIYN